MFATTALLTPKITVKNPKNFFAFQTGHIEIGKVTKFGVIGRPFAGAIQKQPAIRVNVYYPSYLLQVKKI